MRWLLYLIFLNVTCMAQAAQVTKTRAIAEQLKCPTCVAQSVADSQASAAKEIRRIISQRLAQNKTEQEIITELTERYGEHILLTPPLTPSTYLLWFLPFVTFGLGLLIWFIPHNLQTTLTQK